MRNRVSTEIMANDLGTNDRQTKSHQNLISVWAFVKMSNQATFHGQTDKQHDGYRQEHSKRHGIIDNECTGDGKLGFQNRHFLVGIKKGDAFILYLGGYGQHLFQRNRTKSAKHKKCAMRKIHHPKGAENQSQPKSNQRVRTALVQTIQNL